MAVWREQTRVGVPPLSDTCGSVTLDSWVLRTSASSLAEQMRQFGRAAVRISWDGVSHSPVPADGLLTFLLPHPASTQKGEGQIPKNRTGSVGNRLSYRAPRTSEQSCVCGLWPVHQDDRMGLGELIIQQTRPSQIPSKGMVGCLLVHGLYKIVKGQHTSKASQKTQAWVWQEFLSHWVFLCVVYNNMQTWCQVLIY